MVLDSKKDLRATVWDVLLKRGGITKEDIDKRVIEIRVSMSEHGEADDFEMTLSNRDGFFSDPDKFRIGDEIALYIYFADRTRVYMGTYTIDDITDESMPSQVRVSGLSSDTVKKELRTVKSRGFEGISLFNIVRDIAEKHNLIPHIKGKDIFIGRKEQKEQTDLAFLSNLAEDYGFLFRINGEKLYFTDYQEAEKSPPVSLEGIIRRRVFRYKSYKTYKRMAVRYYDPQKKQYIESIVEAGDIKNIQTGKKTIRAESYEQAERMAIANLRAYNNKEMTCEIDCLGIPELMPGINVKIENEGKLYDGIWHIEKVEHRYSKQAGYTVNLQGYKIRNDIIRPTKPSPYNPPISEQPYTPPYVPPTPEQPYTPPPQGPSNLILFATSSVDRAKNQTLFDIEIGLQGDGHEFAIKGYLWDNSEIGRLYPLFVGYSNETILYSGNILSGQRQTITKTVRFTDVPVNNAYVLSIQVIRNNTVGQVFRGNVITVED